MSVSAKYGGCLCLAVKDELTFAAICRCYKSQRKNEAPYKVRVDVEKEPMAIINARCECPIGPGGACGHATGLLYTLGSYQTLGYYSIPTDIACTSQPMLWYAPRGPKIGGKEVQNSTVLMDKIDISNQSYAMVRFFCLVFKG